MVDNTPPAPDAISFAFPPAVTLPAGPPANAPACGDPRQPTESVTGDIVVQDDMGGGDDDEDDEGDDGDDDGDDGDDED